MKYLLVIFLYCLFESLRLVYYSDRIISLLTLPIVLCRLNTHFWSFLRFFQITGNYISTCFVLFSEFFDCNRKFIFGAKVDRDLCAYPRAKKLFCLETKIEKF